MSETLANRVASADFTRAFGVVQSIRSDWIESTGPAVKVGAFCHVGAAGANAQQPLVAEVVSIDGSGLRLVPLGPVDRVNHGSRVTIAQLQSSTPDVMQLGGRAIDALGQPIDDGAEVKMLGRSARRTAPPGPLQRETPSQRLETGIRAIDGLLPLAQGQKIGIFAPSGAGKSSLLEQICEQALCDRVIYCQVGERGREVEKVWRMLSGDARKRPFTLIAATADESPSMRARAGDLAIELAQQARAAGEHVLLLVDSITRVAMALRELGIAAGEPPSSRGYTPNVFSRLPGQIERCGAVKKGGAITAIVSVLSETEDVDDPIVEMMKAILDGHIVLSRSLAERRHFPAIDISRSISRLADEVTPPEQARHVAQLFRLHSRYEEARAMVESGIYARGSDPEIDRAIAAREAIAAFTRQGRKESSSLAQTLQALQSLGGRHGA